MYCSRGRLGIHHLILLLMFSGADSISAPRRATCEQLDGDCPSPCPAEWGRHQATPTLNISELCHGETADGRKLCRPSAAAFVSAASAADAIVVGLARNRSEIVRFDSPHHGLHTSLLYTCCHTKSELQMLRAVLHELRWSSFWVNYSDVGCNVDTHSDIVYLHAMPDAEGQSAFLNLTQTINAEMVRSGIPVHHPRRTKFHMTLARVLNTFAADLAVEEMRTKVFSSAGLQLLFCRFHLFGEVFEAVGGC